MRAGICWQAFRRRRDTSIVTEAWHHSGCWHLTPAKRFATVNATYARYFPRIRAAAILGAEILSRIQDNVGPLRCRTGDRDVGKFEDPVVLKGFGEVPSDLTMLF